MRQNKFIIGVCFIALSLASCASVEPWQKQTLSKKEMEFNSLKVLSSMNTHFYYSKEASSGGQGFSGGGCGCN